MQQMWKEALGVNIVLTNTDWEVYLSRGNSSVGIDRYYWNIGN